MTQELPGTKIENNPEEGSIVYLALLLAEDKSSLDVQGNRYNGYSNGVYSFIRPEKFSISIFKTSEGEFRKDNRGIIFYSHAYDLEFIDQDEEGFRDLVSKLKSWSNK